MIELKEKFLVPASPDEVWPLISDPAVVAACIPGAELNELTPEGAHRGKVTFKFGPTVAVFRGEAKLTYDHPVKRCLIEARGIDQRGASRARARFEVEVRGTETTDVTLEGGFEVQPEFITVKEVAPESPRPTSSDCWRTHRSRTPGSS